MIVLAVLAPVLAAALLLFLLSLLGTGLQKLWDAGFSTAGLMLGVAAFRSEEHTSELQSLMRISYAVFCLKKKNKQNHQLTQDQSTYEHTKRHHTPYLKNMTTS